HFAVVQFGGGEAPVAAVWPVEFEPVFQARGALLSGRRERRFQVGRKSGKSRRRSGGRGGRRGAGAVLRLLPGFHLFPVAEKLPAATARGAEPNGGDDLSPVFSTHLM